LLRFNDEERMEAGASAIFSMGAAAAWTPGPGSWLPPRRGALVANMITFDDRRFGYMLLDAEAEGSSTFEYLRMRFSGIFRDLSLLQGMRQLNSEMAREIAAREKSEARLKEALALVEQMSIEDDLTGLCNRRGFLTLAEQQIKFLRRQKVDFIVLYIDLDGLKLINDGYGHKEGDLAIQAAAKVLRGALRDSDILARLGGDEFTALASKADPGTLEDVKERLAELIDDFNRVSGKAWKLSMSLGHFYARPDCRFGVSRMLELADAELYAEKQEKRGRAV
jgi:diguanylate cyclase (GGDEF)-like protein